MKIDTAYMPAIITAVTGLISIFINLLIELYFRFSDKKIRIKEKMQVGIEEYYMPICMKLENIYFKMNLITINIENNKEIMEFLCGKKLPSIEDEKVVHDLKKDIIEINKLVNKLEYKYVNDIKLQIYYRKVIEIIEILSNTLEYNKEIQNNDIMFKYINLFRDRVKNRIICYSSRNIWNYWYFLIKNKYDLWRIHHGNKC